MTLLESVRELKALGVDVFFQEQNIHTQRSDVELMLTILAPYAQEESRSASDNQKWRIRREFENGALVNWRFLFGCNISKNSIEVDDETAPTVRKVFARVIAGESFNAISRDLNSRGITCALGGKWCAYRIRETFSRRKVWHSTDAYKREIWQCNSKFKNGERFGTPTLTTEDIQQRFIKAYNLQMTELPRVRSWWRGRSSIGMGASLLCSTTGTKSQSGLTAPAFFLPVGIVKRYKAKTEEHAPWADMRQPTEHVFVRYYSETPVVQSF